MGEKFQIPGELMPWQAQFLATERDFIKVKTVDRPIANLWESRLGGQPYWPKELVYPTNKDGKQLYFLSQLNFGDIPQLDGFPETGILQFFIFDDATFGADLDKPDNQDCFRIVYHPSPISDAAELIQDFSFLRFYGETAIPQDRSFALEFAKATEIVPLSDKHFAESFGEDFLRQFGDEEWEIREKYKKTINAEGHKIGGYVFFAQEDDREPDDDSILLFQLDSEVERELCWGDMGAAHFFIQKEDLAKRDFSKVKFSWDCY